MTDFKFGDIVLVPFPVTDQSAALKKIKGHEKIKGHKKSMVKS